MNILKLVCILSLLLFVNNVLFAQTKPDSIGIAPSDTQAIERTPYNHQGNYQTWAIKGKVLPFPLGNRGGLNALIGFEYGFLKNHSIGFDIYYLGIHEHDDDGSNDDLGETFRVDYEFFLNYRFYFSFKKLREKYGLVLYTGAFERYGTSNESFRGSLSVISDNDSIVFSESKHYSTGILTGMLFPLNYNNFWIDFNFGFFYKQTERTNTDYLNGENTPTTSIANFNTFNMRVGLNLYWTFIR